MPKKQHRKGQKTSRKIANLEAISDHIERNLCLGCMAEITEADSEAGECTQCGTPILNQSFVEVEQTRRIA